MNNTIVTKDDIVKVAAGVFSRRGERNEEAGSTSEDRFLKTLALAPERNADDIAARVQQEIREREAFLNQLTALKQQAYTQSGSSSGSGEESIGARFAMETGGRIVSTLDGNCPFALGVESRGADAALRIVDKINGRTQYAVPHGASLITPLHMHSGSMLIAAFSDDGTKIAYGVNNKDFPNQAVSVFEASSGKKLFDIPADGKEVTAIQFSDDGKKLAVGMTDRNYTKPPEGDTKLSVTQEKEGAPVRLEFIEGPKNKLVMFDGDTGEKTAEVPVGDSVVTGIDINPSSDRMLVEFDHKHWNCWII